jgi:competence protein ComGC
MPQTITEALIILFIISAALFLIIGILGGIIAIFWNSSTSKKSGNTDKEN